MSSVVTIFYSEDGVSVSIWNVGSYLSEYNHLIQI